MTLKELIDRRHPFKVGVSVSAALTGSRKAVWDGHHLYVSPAVMALLEDATGFEQLARVLKVVHIPALDFTAPLPMTTTP